MIRFLFLALLVLGIATPAIADPLIQTAAKQAIIVDYDTGTVLLEKNADEKMPTSSMSKVITMYMVFEALKRGDITMETKFTVSEKAWRMGGSKMFLEVDKQVHVEDLIRGLLVQSGNDASIVLAEGMAGSEDAFADSLNRKAQELGMDNSHFENASGWPDENHYSTARDLSLLGIATIRNFPEYYPYYAELEFSYNNISQKNRNPLLYRNVGADGIKTGHTEAGGYGLLGSGTYSGRRVVFVVNGLADDKERAQESAKLLEWALKSFENKTLFKAGQAVEQARTVLGKSDFVSANLKEDLVVTIPKAALNDFKVTAHFKEPIMAPVAQGQEIGELVVEIPNMPATTRPLYAAESVEKTGLFSATLLKARMILGGGDAVANE
jgi:D-alanyl-D-alanine carboxypeptidase (penicillin-binding protein 5/6)